MGSKPVADFSAAPIPVCGTQPVYFTNLTVPSDEWIWDFGDGGSSTLQNPQHSYSCLLYTSDAADERSSVDLGGRRIIKKKKKKNK